MDIILITQVIRTQGYEVIRNIQTKEYFVFDPIYYTIIPLHIYIHNLHQNYILYYNYYNQHMYNQYKYNQHMYNQTYLSKLSKSNSPKSNSPKSNSPKSSLKSNSSNNEKYIHPNSPKNKVKFSSSPTSPTTTPNTTPNTTPKPSWNCF